MIKLTPEMIESIKEQYKQGVPVPEIASSFGVSKVTIYKHLGDAGLVKNADKEVSIADKAVSNPSRGGVKCEMYLDGGYLVISIPVTHIATLLFGGLKKK